MNVAPLIWVEQTLCPEIWIKQQTQFKANTWERDKMKQSDRVQETVTKTYINFLLRSSTAQNNGIWRSVVDGDV